MSTGTHPSNALDRLDCHPDIDDIVDDDLEVTFLGSAASKVNCYVAYCASARKSINIRWDLASPSTY